ncbi:DNA/RNA non-specific endonuclease [Gemmata sp. G18]|uniref:DNA/RNA non-specific endonuclease n=1 Tax=Gemmata palustris TaxID=2822762 RepID=A0ABS5BSJ7_9BACT|nr:DNA/RNA non-specific endonuclease [Gemmata palustris]MBP3956640.1 DNA/RNA non-specific endonuclease [Gemmata palustris]
MAAKSFLDSLTPTQRVIAGVVILVVAGVVALVRSRQEGHPPGPQGDQLTLENRNVRFGMPADAKHDPASREAYLIERPQYVLSYNDATRNPNWVCWNLSAGDIGTAERDTSFEPDPDLPKDFYRVKPSDYTASGFDRGHMCASKDRSNSKEDNEILFYMTNIVPQAPSNNQKGWRLLEEHCRSLAKKGDELHIACGPHGQGGFGKDDVKHLTIGKAHPIAVPESVWKVVMVLPNKTAVPNTDTQVFAVWMPNDQTVGSDWKKYVVPVSTVEQRTGYKFFPLVPDDVAGPIKNHADRVP